MKKVLFVVKNLNLGGSVTSLLNMLELLKENGYSVDLFPIEHTGIFLERAKNAANLLPENLLLATSICDAGRIRRDYGLKGVIYRGILSIAKRFINQVKLREFVLRHCARYIKNYDVAVAYQEDIITRYFTSHIPSPNKIAWIHTIYDRFAKNASQSEIFDIYKKFNNIVCVVGAGANAFCIGQPELAERVVVVNNPLNVKQIVEKSNKKIKLKDGFKIISIGRLSKEKQYEYCVDAALKLVKDEYEFKWYIIGDGQEKDRLCELIHKNNLENVVELTGAMENPYPILSQADVLVISSSYEAQPMVANEALILGVPVVTTNYDSAYEVIQNGENGLICENSSEALYSAVKELLSNKELMLKLKKNAMAFSYDNQTVLNETVKLIYGEDYE